MRQFADHVISVANNSGTGITNLQLQKVMYFVLGDYIKENGIDNLVQDIYSEPFEAWPYGPVIKTEYFRHKVFGRYNIRQDGEYNSTYQVFDDTIIKYIKEPINDLVEESHKHNTWSKNRELILQYITVKYRLEDLQNDFAS